MWHETPMLCSPGPDSGPAIETSSGARDPGRGWERGQWRHDTASTNERPGPLVSANEERGDHEWWRWPESQEGESRVLVSMKPHELRPSYEAVRLGWCPVSQAQARPSTWPQPVSVLTEENQAAATDQVDKSSILVIKQSLKLTDSKEDHQLYPSVNEENSWLLLII